MNLAGLDTAFAFIFLGALALLAVVLVLDATDRRFRRALAALQVALVLFITAIFIVKLPR
jgi:uncharacterized membrane protein YgdD (TMEM256/DUF423 family)